MTVMERELATLAPLFDIALLSCGAWAPLVQACLARDLGKSSVYMGGALQLHFGIWGGRYNASREVSEVATEHWTWPTPQETNELRNNLGSEFSSYATPSDER